MLKYKTHFYGNVPKNRYDTNIIVYKEYLMSKNI